MALHVVVGAGYVGSAVARLLLSQGHEVRVITRRGSGPDGARRVAADAADAARMVELTGGATAVYNCVNPAYDGWERLWPPIAASLLAAAETNGAVLAITGNLYAYGPVEGPMTEDLPLVATGTKGRVRAEMTTAAFAAHAAGRARVVEVRGSDYLGGESMLSAFAAKALRTGGRALVPADLDAPHSWTNVEDVAALLARVAVEEQAWGRAWHVPSAAACSIRELAGIAGEQVGRTAVLRPMPSALLWSVGVINSMARELRETQYQFRAPYVLDSSAAQRTFGLAATPIHESVRLELARTLS